MALDPKFLTCSKCGRTAPESMSFFAIDTPNRRCIYCQVEFLELQSRDYKEAADLWSTRWLRLKENFEKLELESQARAEENVKLATRMNGATDAYLEANKRVEQVERMNATLCKTVNAEVERVCQERDSANRLLREERDRCAKIASEEPKNCQNATDDYSKGFLDGSLATAGAIRRRIVHEPPHRSDECPKCKTRCCVMERGAGKFFCDHCGMEFAA